MTDAERQQLKRDRRKAGLVLVQVWVPVEMVQPLQVFVEGQKRMVMAARDVVSGTT